MSGAPWRIAHARYAEVRAVDWQLVVLPWGATEPHNLHLPYATDVIETERIADRAAALAWERGARAAVLPCVPFGVNSTQIDLPFAIDMRPTTQLAVLRDVLHSLEAQRVPKLVILNGHGGNDFRWMIRELVDRTPVFLCVVDWFRMLDPRRFFDVPGDHAGELETSLMQHLAPDTVAPLAEAGDGAVRSPTVAALRDGWAWTPRPWSTVTRDTGVGDPKAATPVKGARYFDAVTDQLADFLVELAGTDPERLYG